MERLIVILTRAVAVLTFIALSSCSEQGVDKSRSEAMTFGASYVSDVARTVLSNGTKVLWEDGDQIYVSGAEQPFTTSLSAPSASAEFAGKAPVADVYYAVNPYSAVSDYADNLILGSMPSFQTARVGSFDPKANICVSSKTDQDKNFAFHHVPGYVHFNVGASSGAITSVTVQTTGGEPLSGSFYVDCSEIAPEAVPDEAQPYVCLTSETPLAQGDYYIAMFPGVYEDGLSFTFEGPDGVAVKTIKESIDLERGKVNTLGTVRDLDWDNGESFYVKVAQSYDDWSGEYLIT